MTSTETPPQGQVDGAATGSGEGELRALLEAATPRPWFYRPREVRHGGAWIADHPGRGQHSKIIVVAGACYSGSDDYKLIVAAVNTLPRHLDEIAQLKVRVEELEAANESASKALGFAQNGRSAADVENARLQSRLAASEAENARKAELLATVLRDTHREKVGAGDGGTYVVSPISPGTFNAIRQALSTNVEGGRSEP